MAKVKVFVTDGQTDGRMRFNVPTLSRKQGTIIPMKWDHKITFTKGVCKFLTKIQLVQYIHTSICRQS